jgi:hypothetical protein
VQKYASGEYVTHAYVRLFQNFPEEYGSSREQIGDSVIASPAGWQCSPDTAAGWLSPEFKDSSWQNAKVTTAQKVAGFGATVPSPLALNGESPGASTVIDPSLYFRRTFTLNEMPLAATLVLHSTGTISVFLNGAPVSPDSISVTTKTGSWNLMGKLRTGKNTLGIKITAIGTAPGILYPMLVLRISRMTFSARPPGQDKPFSDEEIRSDVYKFPFIKNFSPEGAVVKK